MIEEGYVDVNKHPEAELYIYNYTRQTQFAWVWNQTTISCRGLILDGNGTVVARPFQKFFTVDQYRDLRNHIHNLYGVHYKNMYQGPFSVTEKMDGSMGIMYRLGNDIRMASRGSFTSTQAIKGTELLQRYKDFPFANGITYLYEIIYPDNRIVVDYGKLEDVVLIACIDNETGKDSDEHFRKYCYAGLPTTKRLYFDSFDDVLLANMDNAEGYVVLFNNGMRVKVKFSEYVRLHAILTNITKRTIWEYLRDKKDINTLLEVLPDEYDKWASNVIKELQTQYDGIEHDCYGLALSLKRSGLSRKDIADKLKFHRRSAIIFLMLDNRDYSAIIWKEIQPDSEKPRLVCDE